MPAVEKYVIYDWKRLWQMVSGIHYETPKGTVREELLNVCSELQAGVLQFKPKSASNVQLCALLKEKKQEKLLPFTERLQELLNLESAQCWEILCYYLTKEYRGSASLLTQLISTETNMTKLLDDIRHYYSLERMIVLKIVKNLLVFYHVPNHPYHAEYREVVDKITLERLLESYLNQLDSLINELPPRKLLAGESFHCTDRLTNWSERNARETNEVLHILLLISEHRSFSFSQITRLFSTIKQHSFGRLQSYLNESNPYHKELIKTLTYSELMLLLKCLDSDNGELIQQLIEELHVEISSMHHRPEHGPLLLVWMLLRLRGTNDADDASSLLRCRQLGKRAVELKCFELLHSIATHAMFSDDSLLSRIVRKTIYNQLCYMCDLFDGDGSCARYDGIFALLCELLSFPQLAKDFCNRKEDGVRSLYNTLLENFPLQFIDLANVAYALTKAGQGNYIKAQMESLPMLALLYDEQAHKLRELETNEYELTSPLQAFPGIDFTLPIGTSCTAVQHANGFYMHFRCQVNFFNALHHEINCLLREKAQLHGDFESNERVLRVEAGLRYLELTLQRIKSIAAISPEMVHPTEMCIDLLSKFRSVQCPPARLLSICLNVCTALLPLVDEEIFMRVSHLDILPKTGSQSLQDYKLCASAVYFESRFLGAIIDNVEKKQERYDFLLAYLHFLRTYTKLKRQRYLQVEIPGLVFLLRDVFPHLHTWHFKSQLDKNKIYFEVLSFICDLFDIMGSSNEVKCEKRQLLLNVCVYSLLNLDNGLILLKFVGVGNAFVQYTMELETNWMQQQPHGLMMLVRLSMRILMQVLCLKSHVYGTGALSPLEALIYTQPKQRDTLRIIPTVCSYMSNIFDRWLPIVSCRLLKRIALEFNMSLLACLDMEADQIRLTFMQKMPDQLESDSIKIAILELVDACIAKQPGVTEAFFKVNYANDKRSFFGKECTPSIGDSIVTYMKEFLDGLEEVPLIIQQTLPCKVLNIFHSLWKHNLKMLVDELLKQPHFWRKLCSPLLTKPTSQPQMRVYTQLINIISIEIYSTGSKKKTDLREVMQKFFELDCFQQWLDYIFNLPKVPAKQSCNEELPDWICCLQSFKDLIVILLKKQPTFITIPDAQFKLLAKKCLTRLVDRANYLEDMRPFIMLAELYIFILLQFKQSYTSSSEEEKELMEQLEQLILRICACYEDLHVRAKEACLAIITKCAHLYANLLIKESSISMRFLNSVVTIISRELLDMEKPQAPLKPPLKTPPQEANDGTVTTNSLLLCLNLLKTVATIFTMDGPGNWDLPFLSVRLFQRLLHSVSQTLPVHNKRTLSIQLLDVLIVFAKSNCSTEFLYCDMGEHLWLKLLPPRELLHAKLSFKKSTKDNVWTMEQWWPIYSRGIELVNIIYDKHKKCFLQEVIQFVGIHEVYLVDSLLLGKQSLEPAAMKLIKAAISLVASLTNDHKEWAQENCSSMLNIMNAVQGLMCHAMSMFHQQRNLKCLLAGRRSQLEMLRNMESITIDDDMINACNDLTDIIIFCVKAMQKFSPDLLDILCCSYYEPHKWQPLLDVKFGAPKLNESSLTLTFGMVLNMVTIYVKALTMQNHGFHEVPLNTLPSVEIGEATGRIASGETSQGQRSFSHSVSTAGCPSSELLSNLDGQLCLVALEHLLMLVASQSIYVIRSPELEPRWKQIVRRDISSDLLSFHEFVRRKVIVDYRDARCQWVRRKHGLLKFRPQNVGRSPAIASGSQRGNEVARRSTTANELRVNVVRRLHLQQHPQPLQPQSGSLEMTRMLSPIAAPHSGGRHQMAASTPQDSTDVSETQHENRKRLYAAESMALEVQYLPPPTEPIYCELSQVQLVEEDYLQLMSALFSVIPQTE
ncbi:PREDICTED: nucleoporin NUP188 homolog isoform X1 [Drosophila arizonae]|uniref:Nucleoporin NUP188 n=1 Tax=Drosophila arizonae TaxID=7263 RepID=A0ABM1PIE1_DROAR|nr:PREDICTED: nucleoporin NUP188 homolog isoform X1 [Drosophila arizonae]